MRPSILIAALVTTGQPMALGAVVRVQPPSRPTTAAPIMRRSPQVFRRDERDAHGRYLRVGPYRETNPRSPGLSQPILWQQDARGTPGSILTVGPRAPRPILLPGVESRFRVFDVRRSTPPGNFQLIQRPRERFFRLPCSVIAPHFYRTDERGTVGQFFCPAPVRLQVVSPPFIARRPLLFTVENREAMGTWVSVSPTDAAPSLHFRRRTPTPARSYRAVLIRVGYQAVLIP